MGWRRCHVDAAFDRPPPDTWPALPSGVGLAYDIPRKRVYAFGGEPILASAPSADLWEWDPAAGTWTNLTPAVLPAAWPSPRGYAMATFESARGRIDNFGGRNTTGLLSELWEWDGADASSTAQGRPSNSGARGSAKRDRQAGRLQRRVGRLRTVGLTRLDESSIADRVPLKRRSPTFEWRCSRR
jgi:hypothetical protein